MYFVRRNHSLTTRICWEYFRLCMTFFHHMICTYLYTEIDITSVDSEDEHDMLRNSAGVFFCSCSVIYNSSATLFTGSLHTVTSRCNLQYLQSCEYLGAHLRLLHLYRPRSYQCCLIILKIRKTQILTW